MDKVRIGVIGCGNISGYHLSALSQIPQAEMLIVCDLIEDKARQACEKYSISQWTTDYREVLNRPDIDAVIILTLCNAHLELISAAAEARKHIFIQKPFASNVKKGLEIYQIVEKAGIRLVTSFMHRYFPECLKAKELTDRKTIGNIFMIRQRNAIHGTYELAVFLMGAVYDAGPHGVDLIRYLTGQEIVRVSAMMNPYTKGISPGRVPKDVSDTISLINYELTDGVLVSHEIVWVQKAGTEAFTTEIYGEKGSIFIRDPLGEKPLAFGSPPEEGQGAIWSYPELKNKQQKENRTKEIDVKGGLRPNISSGIIHHRLFIQDIINNTYNSASAEDGLATLLVTEAAYESAQNEGKAVNIDISLLNSKKENVNERSNYLFG